MIELINHPSHYQRDGRKECIVEMEEKYGAEITAVFCLTNAIKYLYRAGEKIGESEKKDISKAKWYGLIIGAAYIIFLVFGAIVTQFEYDRNGNILATNKTTYEVSISPKDIRSSVTTRL